MSAGSTVSVLFDEHLLGPGYVYESFAKSLLGNIPNYVIGLAVCNNLIQVTFYYFSYWLPDMSEMKCQETNYNDRDNWKDQEEAFTQAGVHIQK